jgi:hypothetical protein
MYLVTELSSSWDAANCAATQELSNILWNPKVLHRVRKSPPLVPILSQIDRVHTVPSYNSKTYFNFVHPLRLVLFIGLFISRFPTNILYTFILSPIRATYPAHLILFDLIILIMFGEEYKLWNSSLMQFPPISRHLISLGSI